MNRVRAILAGIGFIITGIVLSSSLPAHIMPAVQLFKAEIFRTNCLLIFAASSIGDSLPAPPSSCQIIQQGIPASMIANGVILILFGATRWCSLISVLNLGLLIGFYCNPVIDSSMRSYSHFLKVFICLSTFLVVFFRGKDVNIQEKAKQS